MGKTPLLLPALLWLPGLSRRISLRISCLSVCYSMALG
jgi:hypothetical protein